MRLTKILLTSLLLAVLPLSAFAQEASPLGKWKTIDDETGKAKSIVEITRANDGTLRGTVLDPSKGKTYKSKIELLDGGRKLGMSGCIAFFCRQQVWVRE